MKQTTYKEIVFLSQNNNTSKALKANMMVTATATNVISASTLAKTSQNFVQICLFAFYRLT
jgi:hypothetical protein